MMTVNRKKLPSFVVISIMTTITIVVWVAYSVYKVYTKDPVINIKPSLLVPLPDDFDTNLLAQLDQKLYFDIGETNGFAQSQINSIEPVIVFLENVEPNEDENSATQSADIEVVNEATQSAQNQ